MDEILKSPVTLISHGRSGTSLLQNVFANHPEFSVAGETADIIFGTWYSLSMAEKLVPGLFENGKLVPWNERIARSVRAVFQEMFQFQKPRWMHKPISQPAIMGYILKARDLTIEGWLEAYWRILGEAFPTGSFITIIRHPYDVVLSAGQYWGRDQARVWSDMATMARCVTHPSSKINFAVLYDELVATPEAVLMRLFHHLQIPYDPAVLKAFESVYVPNHEGWKQDLSKFTQKAEKRFSRRAEWAKVDPTIPTVSELEVIGRLWDKFGYPLELPGA